MIKQFIYQNALSYSLYTYLFGFLLGAIRVILIAPKVGEAMALTIEIPIMLSISWIFSKRIISGLKNTSIVLCDGESCRKENIKIIPLEMLILGLLAFLMLQLLEVITAFILGGQSLYIYINHQLSFPGSIGFSAQIVFGLIPFFQSIRL